MSRYDVAVVGGGLTGLAAAVGLAQKGRRVAVIDPRPPIAPAREAPIGLRVATFSPASIVILEALHAWQHIDDARRFPFDRMTVWEDDPGTALSFTAASAGLPSLGSVAENDAARAALWSVAESCCDIVTEALVGIDLDERSARLDLANDTTLRTGLVIGADGTRSAVRAAAGIAVDEHDYFQSGVVSVVDCEHPHRDTARQRFVDGLPLAFLPLGPNQVSIVWSLPTAHAHRAVKLPSARFEARLQEASQQVLGALSLAGGRAAFPLRRRSARRYVSGCCALIGDAAHQVHPLAGQGANIGLLDAAALVECLAADVDPTIALRRYERWRRSDAETMSLGIHLIGGAYRWTGAGARLRRFGTALVNGLPGLTGVLAQQAAGLSGRVPALARGDHGP